MPKTENHSPNMKPSPPNSLVLAAGALALNAIVQAQDQTAPVPRPDEPTLQQRVDNTILEAFTKGRFSFNARLRYEYGHQDNLLRSAALTLRPRMGFTTAPLHGFQAMFEAENITLLSSEEDANLAGTTGQPGRTVIADPETTEVNQVWLSYTNWDTTIKGGIQRIALDNHRFIGDIGWRQNMQTFEAVSVENQALEDLALFYSYVWGVNRIFGGQSPAAANQDYDSDSHLFHAAYSGLKGAQLVGYAYLLDFDNAPAYSTATCGGYLAGSYIWDKDRGGKVNYRGEFAWQTDYGRSPVDYGTEYYLADVSADYGRLTLGAAYEVLSSDNAQGFKTPLSTAHAFNGWADLFLVTPTDGLRDFYAYAGVKLPGNVPLKAIYHKFDADTGGADYGWELDLIATRQFGKHLSVLVKYAHYEAADPISFPAGPALFDKDVFWAQVEFNY
jgi:hypothetical protein